MGLSFYKTMSSNINAKTVYCQYITKITTKRLTIDIYYNYQHEIHGLANRRRNIGDKM